MRYKAVLFDLDGTLADTAPDLAGALNRLRGEQGLPALPLALLRPHASAGVRGLLAAGFQLAPEDAQYATLAERFLDLYAANLYTDSRLFSGIAELLNQLDEAGLAWGIVTNKRERFSLPLIQRLGWEQRLACLVSGDTVATTKPSPQPLLHALAQIGSDAADAVYIGDDLRDIIAGRAAGMHTIAAAYGYLGADGDPASWGADFLVHNPAELGQIIFC